MKILPRNTCYKPWPKEWESTCRFCKLDIENIIWRGKYLYIQHNKYPYLGLKNHLLVVPFAHKIFTKELSWEEMIEMIEVEKFMEKFYNSGDYFSFIRQSNSKQSRSVAHLHYHYLPWALNPDILEEALKQQWFHNEL